jgi:hypothetical protein
LRQNAKFTKLCNFFIAPSYWTRMCKFWGHPSNWWVVLKSIYLLLVGFLLKIWMLGN